jgi:hypothetical protein
MAVQVRNLSTDDLLAAQTSIKQLIEFQEGDGCEPDEIWARTAIVRDRLEEWEAYARRSIREAA